jgi:hypothetical protein
MQNICVVLYCHPWTFRLSPYFFLHYLLNATIFGKIFAHERCIFIFCTNLFENALMLRRIQRDVIITAHRPSRTVHVLLVRFESKLNFLDRFCQTYFLLNFMKICSVGTELFLAGWKTGGWTDMTKLIVAFRNFANAPITMHCYSTGLVKFFSLL